MSIILLSSFVLKAQETIKIKEVEVLEKMNSPKEVSRQILDSMSVLDPSNKDLGATLQKYSHAFVKSYGIGSLATVSLRGSGTSHTNLSWNGTIMNNAAIGVVDFSLVPPIFSDNVSVDYGLNSMNSGSGGLGGAVNISSEVDFTSKDEIFLQQQLGSFDYSSTSARIKTGNHKFRSVSRLVYKKANNNFNYSDISEVGSPTTRVENAELEQKGILQSFHFRPNSRQRLDAHIWYFDSERELPNLMTVRDLEESQYDENFRLQLAFHQYYDNSKLSINSSYLRDELIYRNNELESNSLSINHSFRNFIRYDLKWKDFDISNRMDVDKEISEQSSLENEKVERERFAIYNSIQKELSKKLIATIAVRQEVIEEDYFFLPQLRIDFQASEKVQYWALAGKNMKYPSLNDLYWQAGGNEDLEAEESENLEIGQAIQFPITNKLNLTSKLSGFYGLIKNYIQWTPTAQGFWQAENLKKVESLGMDANIAIEHKGKKFQQRYALLYNYVRSINLEKNHEADESLGKQLIYIPEHQYNLNARWAYQSYSLEANLQFVGARYLLADNSDWLPYYDIIDLSVGKDWKLGNDLLSLRFSARNLMNTDYQAIQWRPMPGRNYMLTINYLFK